MQVKSPIANLHIDIKSVSVSGRYIVVKSNTDTSLDTTVKLSPADIWVFIKALFVTPLIFYIAIFPIYAILHKIQGDPDNADNADTHHHPTSHPW